MEPAKITKSQPKITQSQPKSSRASQNHPEPAKVNKLSIKVLPSSLIGSKYNKQKALCVVKLKFV